jgi:hypothetical protein
LNLYEKIIPFFFLVLLTISLDCLANSIMSPIDISKIKLDTCYDDILWIGLNTPDEFDQRNLKDIEKAKQRP